MRLFLGHVRNSHKGNEKNMGRRNKSRKNFPNLFGIGRVFPPTPSEQIDDAQDGRISNVAKANGKGYVLKPQQVNGMRHNVCVYFVGTLLQIWLKILLKLSKNYPDLIKMLTSQSYTYQLCRLNVKNVLLTSFKSGNTQFYYGCNFTCPS